MPNSLITCVYVAQATVTSVATLATRMAAVPIDFTLPNSWGLLLTGDTTLTAGQAVGRTLTFSMIPFANATATAALFGGNPNGSPIKSLTLTSGGGLYAAPPIVTLGGTPFTQASATAQMAVAPTLTPIAGGSGYVAPTVSFSGGQLAPGGTPATGTVTVLAGAVASVTVAANGPYFAPPLVIINPVGGGSGAEVIGGLVVSGVTLTSPGAGYTSPPSVVFTPLFKQMAPDVSNQASILADWMQDIFQANLQCVVRANTPVIS